MCLFLMENSISNIWCFCNMNSCCFSKGKLYHFKSNGLLLSLYLKSLQANAILFTTEQIQFPWYEYHAYHVRLIHFNWTISFTVTFQLSLQKCFMSCVINKFCNLNHLFCNGITTAMATDTGYRIQAYTKRLYRFFGLSIMTSLILGHFFYKFLIVTFYIT